MAKLTKSQKLHFMSRTSVRADNTPPEFIYPAIFKAFAVFKYLEERIPGLLLNSAYRSPIVNQRVKGAAGSFHKYEDGRWALDLDKAGCSTPEAARKLAKKIKAILDKAGTGYDLIFAEHSWVHVQGWLYSDKNRRMYREV